MPRDQRPSPLDLLHLSREPGLPDGAFRLLSIYRSYMNKEGWAWPGDELVSQHMGVTEKTVRNRRGKLADFLEEQGGHLQHEDRGPKPDAYRIVLPPKDRKVSSGQNQNETSRDRKVSPGQSITGKRTVSQTGKRTGRKTGNPTALLKREREVGENRENKTSITREGEEGESAPVEKRLRATWKRIREASKREQLEELELGPVAERAFQRAGGMDGLEDAERRKCGLAQFKNEFRQAFHELSGSKRGNGGGLGELVP